MRSGDVGRCTIEHRTPCNMYAMRCEQVWSLDTLGRVKTLEGHTDAVRALAVSNGRLFSGSYDGTVKVSSLLQTQAHLTPSTRMPDMRYDRQWPPGAAAHAWF